MQEVLSVWSVSKAYPEGHRTSKMSHSPSAREKFVAFAASLVTLGLGLTMMIREFDLSVLGMYGMVGCIAVITGTHHPWLVSRWRSA